MRSRQTEPTTGIELVDATERQPGNSLPTKLSALVGLQAVVGNQVVARMLESTHHRTAGLALSAPDSAAEVQAAEVARNGLRPGSGLVAAAAPAGPSLVTRSQGRPVDATILPDVEQSLRADFSAVRIHDDPEAHAFAHEVGAQAATWGSHIYFGKDRFAPHTEAGQELLRHELVHTVQPTARLALHRTPESEARLGEIEQQLASTVITDEYRTRLEQERRTLLAQGNLLPTPGAASVDPSRVISVVSMSPAEYEALTGRPAATLPEGTLPDAGPELEQPPQTLSGSVSAVPGAIGAGALFTPQPNWYYRVLSPTDPTAAQLLGGANLTPRPPNAGYTFQPASPAEMTFRHLRAGGNVPQTGTNRISTAGSLEAFEGTLANRGTGELVRVDVNLARRLGAQFLEQGDIMGHLDEIGRDIAQQLQAARAAGRGRNHILRLEGRMRALERARDYARTFQEGQGVNSIPGRSTSAVRGSTLSEAVAGEQAFHSGLRFFRYGGRVLLVVGAGMSVARVVSAPPEEQARVATQEAGGWAFSMAGAAAGGQAGAALGAAVGWETGPGAIVVAALGSLIGAALGFFGGQEAADELYDVGERAVEGGRLLGDPARFMETSMWMFGTPEDRGDFYEMREILTGEPNPFEGL